MASGIELAFLIMYKCCCKVNFNDKEVNVIFIDEVGDYWEEYNVFYYKFLVWLEVNGYDVDKVCCMFIEELIFIIEQLFYYLVIVNDVDWV